MSKPAAAGTTGDACVTTDERSTNGWRAFSYDLAIKHSEEYEVTSEHCRRADARSYATESERKQSRRWLDKQSRRWLDKQDAPF